MGKGNREFTSVNVESMDALKYAAIEAARAAFLWKASAKRK